MTYRCGCVRSKVKLLHSGPIRHGHAAQKHKSGAPCYLHPTAAACLVLERSQDEGTLLAALLHDVVQDTPMTLVQLRAGCNPTVVAPVGAVTKLDKRVRRRTLAKGENLQRLDPPLDPRALEVPMAAPWHSMQTIASHPLLAKRKKAAQEIRDFFCP